MRIGIIKYDDNEYNVDIKDKVLSVIKITNKEVSSLSESAFNDLIKEIFDSNLKYKTKSNGYEIFEDEVGNKRFFKDGKENFYLFFIANGESALEYIDKNDNNKEQKYKKYKLKNKAVGVIYILLALGYIPMIITSAMSLKNDIQYRFEQAELQSIIEDYEITSNQIIDGINRLNISDEQKKYLCNNDFFDDIIKVFNNRQKYNIDNKLKDIKLTYFTESQKESSSTWMGQYNPIINRISLRDNTEKTFNFAMAHELIHLLQENNQYSYINEATATILANEYYNGPQNYNNEVKNIKFLMELIGPKPILECSFKGDTTSFENKIHEVLNEEDANELLSIFSSMANDEESHIKKNEALDRIYNNMCNNIYGHDIKDDKYLSFLKDNELRDRIYFNEHSENINKRIIMNTEIANEIEINIEDAERFKCIESKKIITEEKINDDIINYKYSHQQSSITYCDYDKFIEEYNKNKENKDTNTEYLYSITPKNTFDRYSIVIYGKDKENGITKFYTVENPTYLPTIPEKFPDQFKEANKVDILFTNTNENEVNEIQTIKR